LLNFFASATPDPMRAMDPLVPGARISSSIHSGGASRVFTSRIACGNTTAAVSLAVARRRARGFERELGVEADANVVRGLALERDAAVPRAYRRHQRLRLELALADFLRESPRRVASVLARTPHQAFEVPASVDERGEVAAEQTETLLHAHVRRPALVVRLTLDEHDRGGVRGGGGVVRVTPFGRGVRKRSGGFERLLLRARASVRATPHERRALFPAEPRVVHPEPRVVVIHARHDVGVPLDRVERSLDRVDRVLLDRRARGPPEVVDIGVAVASERRKSVVAAGTLAGLGDDFAAGRRLDGLGVRGRREGRDRRSAPRGTSGRGAFARGRA
jgi:hypothetical protein